MSIITRLHQWNAPITNSLFSENITQRKIMRSKLTVIIAGTMLPELGKLFSSRNIKADGRFLISSIFLFSIIPISVNAQAVLDPNYQPTAYVTRTGVGDTAGTSPSLIRLRTTWQGDGDQDAQCNSLLDSFRNRAGSAGVGLGDAPNEGENWQCWSGGDAGNGYTLWYADISLWAIDPRVMRPDGNGGAACWTTGGDNRADIQQSLNEHFNTEVGVEGLADVIVAHECE
ncbi:MAG: hypothetical protein ACRC80_07495 [Waterburya sp.]|jgi:hypothetical protein